MYCCPRPLAEAKMVNKLWLIIKASQIHILPLNLGDSAYLQTICSVVAMFTQQVTPRPFRKRTSAGILPPSSVLALGVGELAWLAWKHEKEQSSSPCTKVKQLPNFFLLFFLKQKLGKAKQERDSMGLAVPVLPQLSYPVSLVNVAHRESKYAAVTSVEKLWGELKKKFVPLGEVNENVNRKHSYFCVCKGALDALC